MSKTKHIIQTSVRSRQDVVKSKNDAYSTNIFLLQFKIPTNSSFCTYVPVPTSLRDTYTLHNYLGTNTNTNNFFSSNFQTI